jgi:hypothetical protein
MWRPETRLAVEGAWPITVQLTARIEAHAAVSATPTREVALTGIGAATSGGSATLRLS